MIYYLFLMGFLFSESVFAFSEEEETGVVICEKSDSKPMRWAGEKGPGSLMDVLKICKESGGRPTQIHKTQLSGLDEASSDENVVPEIWKKVVKNAGETSIWLKIVDDLYKIFNM